VDNGYVAQQHSDDSQGSGNYTHLCRLEESPESDDPELLQGHGEDLVVQLRSLLRGPAGNPLLEHIPGLERWTVARSVLRNRWRRAFVPMDIDPLPKEQRQRVIDRERMRKAHRGGFQRMVGTFVKETQEHQEERCENPQE
jgi:hypothetical protein